MIVANCPRCDESFRLPSGQLPDDAFAHCPWCRESFPLSDVISRLPPILEITGADGQPLALQPEAELVATGAAVSTTADTVVSPLPADTEDISGLSIDEEIDPSSIKTVTDETIHESWNETASTTGNDAADFDVEDPNDTWEPNTSQNAAPDAAADPIAPMHVTPAPTPQLRNKKKGSSFRTLLSIVLGGLAAGPLAVALLYILTLFGVHVDLGFWPLDGSNTSSTGQQRAAATPVDLANRQPLAPPPAPSPGRSLTEGTDFDAQDDTAEAAETAALNAILQGGSTEQVDGAADLTENETEDQNLLASDPIDDASQPDLVPPLNDDDAQITAAAAPKEDPLQAGDVIDDLLNEEPVIEMPENLVDDASEASPKIAIPESSEIHSLASNPQPLSDDKPTPDVAEDDPELILPTNPKTVDLLNPEVATEPPTKLELPETGNIEVVDIGSDTTEVAQPEIDASEGTESTEPAKDIEMPLVEDAAQPSLDPEPLPNEAAEVVSKVDAPIENGLRMETEPAEPEPIKEAPELIAATKTAIEKLDAMSSYDRSDTAQQGQLARTYLAVAEAAAEVEGNSKSARQLLDKLKTSPLLPHLTNAVPSWLNYSSRPTDGVLAIGDVQEGKMVVADGTSIAVSGAELPPGDKLIALGRIVESGDQKTIEIAVADVVE